MDNGRTARKPGHIMPLPAIVGAGIKSITLVAELGLFLMTGHPTVAMAAVASYTLSYKTS